MKSKVLSVRQPFADLIINGHKDVENRHWPTKHRGPLLIHAGKSWGMVKPDMVRMYQQMDIPMPAIADFQLGGIIGIVEVVDCVQNHPSEWAIEGAWHWVLRNPMPVEFIPLKGMLGLFNYDGEVFIEF